MGKAWEQFVYLWYGFRKFNVTVYKTENMGWKTVASDLHLLSGSVKRPNDGAQNQKSHMSETHESMFKLCFL